MRVMSDEVIDATECATTKKKHTSNICTGSSPPQSKYLYLVLYSTMNGVNGMNEWLWSLA